MCRSRSSLLLIIAGSLLLASCAPFTPPATTAPTVKDLRYPKCDRPSDITLNEVDISTATTEIGDVKIGAITYKSTPKLAEVVSSASNKSLVVNYLLCVATESGQVSKDDQKGIAYLREYLGFLQSDPTAEQQLEWQKLKHG